MIYLVLDFLLSYVCNIPTFFFLINLVLIKKENYSKLLIITLVLDLLLLNTYFLNTIILSLIFLLYKKLNIVKKSWLSYLFSLFLIYTLYVFIIGIINGYSLTFISIFLLKNSIYNFIFYLLCYKIEHNHIELSR